MGVLPLQFADGESVAGLGLSGEETFDVTVGDDLQPRAEVMVTARDPKTGKAKTFATTCRIDSPVEVEYYRNGGILQTVLRKLVG
jgi:aconitate hydratase